MFFRSIAHIRVQLVFVQNRPLNSAEKEGKDIRLQEARKDRLHHAGTRCRGARTRKSRRHGPGNVIFHEHLDRFDGKCDPPFNPSKQEMPRYHVGQKGRKCQAPRALRETNVHPTLCIGTN